MMRLLLLLSLLLCSSCIQLGSEAQPTRYYLLAPVAETLVQSAHSNIDIYLESIILPSYLDRPQIVSRKSNNQIKVASHDRWAEPLPENFTRTLQENLYGHLDKVNISSINWSNGTTPAYHLKISVNRFDGIIGEQTDVDIRWSLSTANQNKETLRKHFVAKLPVEDGYQNLVEGLNYTLAELSKDIAEAILKIEN